MVFLWRQTDGDLLCVVSWPLGCSCLRAACAPPDGQAVVEVQLPGGDQQEALVRKRTAGVLDMGGVSTQIAYEVAKTVSFASPQQVIIHQTNSVLSPAVFDFFATYPSRLLLPSPRPPVITVQPVCILCFVLWWWWRVLHSTLLVARCKPSASIHSQIQSPTHGNNWEPFKLS